MQFHRTDIQTPNVRKRGLAGDAGAAKVTVIERGAPPHQLATRGLAETPEAHGGNGHPRGIIKIEKAIQLLARVGASGDLENIRAELLRGAGFFVKAENGRGGFEIVKRNDALNVPGARQIEDGKKRRRGA